MFLILFSEEEDRDRMDREFHKEEELIHLSQKMMEDNEFRIKSTKEANENEKFEIKEFFEGKIRETISELSKVSEVKMFKKISFFLISYVPIIATYLAYMKSKRKISKMILIMNN
jgi:hypothetical protein